MRTIPLRTWTWDRFMLFPKGCGFGIFGWAAGKMGVSPKGWRKTAERDELFVWSGFRLRSGRVYIDLWLVQEYTVYLPPALFFGSTSCHAPMVSINLFQPSLPYNFLKHLQSQQCVPSNQSPSFQSWGSLNTVCLHAIRATKPQSKETMEISEEGATKTIEIENLSFCLDRYDIHSGCFYLQ